MTASDRRLVRRLLDGDDAAFDQFFDGHFPRLYRFALRRMNGDHDAAEEAVQLTLTRALDKLQSYRGEAALFTWLCTFCRHEISAYYRRERRQPPAATLDEDDPEIAAALDSLWASHGEGPEAALGHREVAELVRAVLDRLPGRYGDALEWKYCHGLSMKEIGRRMGLGQKAVESLLTRARAAFRDGFSSVVLGGDSRLARGDFE